MEQNSRSYWEKENGLAYLVPWGELWEGSKVVLNVTLPSGRSFIQIFFQLCNLLQVWSMIPLCPFADFFLCICYYFEIGNLWFDSEYCNWVAKHVMSPPLFVFIPFSLHGYNYSTHLMQLARKDRENQWVVFLMRFLRAWPWHHPGIPVTSFWNKEKCLAVTKLKVINMWICLVQKQTICLLGCVLSTRIVTCPDLRQAKVFLITFYSDPDNQRWWGLNLGSSDMPGRCFTTEPWYPPPPPNTES